MNFQNFTVQWMTFKINYTIKNLSNDLIYIYIYIKETIEFIPKYKNAEIPQGLTLGPLPNGNYKYYI